MLLSLPASERDHEVYAEDGVPPLSMHVYCCYGNLIHNANRHSFVPLLQGDEDSCDDPLRSPKEPLPVPASTDEGGKLVVGLTVSFVPKLTELDELVIGVRMINLIDGCEVANGSLCI